MVASDLVLLAGAGDVGRAVLGRLRTRDVPVRAMACRDDERAAQLNWSGLPVVHIRPTSFLDNPLFTTLAAQSIRENGTIALPFGNGRTSPIAVDDVARVVATVLRDPAPHIGHVYELTGPRAVDMTEMAEEFSRALGRPVSYVDVPLDRWRAEVLAKADLPPHTEQHIATMARLHRENRYDRASYDVERVTGVPAQTIEAFVAARRDFYLG
ncbi:NmrA family NAD(P)-binding protein [Nonomuraea polychroma]|uniref:NmrA family NAD(P)-binding protein n=1 Tax=Nonomuraea polychroma TaxID=46176 RepID=UPI003D949351